MQYDKMADSGNTQEPILPQDPDPTRSEAPFNGQEPGPVEEPLPNQTPSDVQPEAEPDIPDTPETPVAKPVIEATRTFRIPPTFSIRAVDFTAVTSGVPGDDLEDPVAESFEPLEAPTEQELKARDIEETDASEAPPVDDRRLGGLDEFVGNFVGNGLNTIFRPRNGPKGMSLAHDNLLEINVTKEELQFLNRDILDAVPNRGFGGPEFSMAPQPQPDVILRGVPYMQRINDLIDQSSLTLREPGVAIHFEQGLFLRTPALIRPDIGATISRLASIPHGSTINAQCIDPGFAWTPGPPDFSGDHSNLITPFFINKLNIGKQEPDLPNPKPGSLVQFPNMTSANATRNRIPNMIQGNEAHDSEELQAFAELDAVKNFKMPINTLINYNKSKVIRKHRTFEVTTIHDSIPGGGTSNIGFLQGRDLPIGTTPTDANASAVKVTCRYWISVVRVMLEVGPTSHSRVEVNPIPTPGTEPPPNGVTYVHPIFIVQLKRALKEKVQFEVDYVQIQYLQNVTLDFGPLSWPHVSVASLIPAGLDMSGKIEVVPEQLPVELQ